MARHLTLLATWLVTLSAQAQSLPDPTLLPPGLATVGKDAVVSGSPLQSIILSGERKLAVISGQIVPLGGMVGESRLVRITPTQVTLRNGAVDEVLSLYSGVEKTPASSQIVKQSKSKSDSQSRGGR